MTDKIETKKVGSNNVDKNKKLEKKLKSGTGNSSSKKDLNAINDTDLSNDKKIGNELTNTLPNVKERNAIDEELMKNFEREVMGENIKGRKSDLKERNLNQMVEVLHLRLSSLSGAAQTRMRLCEEDVNPNSQKTSKEAPKLTDEYENETTSKPSNTGINKSNQNNVNDKHNLVSTDGIFIDPQHLVIRTKPVTETSKKLELQLEDTFGTANLRDLKGKKSKNNQKERSKKFEQQKNEAKKMQRLKLEKDLAGNMEQFVTRSAHDPELNFTAPFNDTEDLHWPISIKWPDRDPRSLNPENAEGQMDPELILQYAVGRINLPACEPMFLWLMRQAIIQDYFVSLFWLIKVKFFQAISTTDDEEYLIKSLSITFAKIIDLVALRAYAEHEKDFTYKYLPFILSNAVHFAFYFLCPGSRHIYSKGFRKTIFLQVVQIMHGVQLCPITVKVLWSKLFPEENHEGDDEGIDEGHETVPVQIAFNSSKKLPAVKTGILNVTLNESTMNMSGVSSPGGLNKSMSDGHLLIGTKNGGIMSDNDGNSTQPSRPWSAGEDLDKEFSKTKPPLLPTVKVFNSTKIVHPTPFSRTLLKPCLEKPGKNVVALRQSQELSDAKEMSPLIQQYLAAESSSGVRGSQKISKTVPVSWCAAGGSDTHKKIIIERELHENFTDKAKQLEKEYKNLNWQSHRLKIKSLQQVDKALNSVLNSGNTSISRYSLDLLKRSRNSKGQIIKESSTLEIPVEDSDYMKWANYDDDLDAFFASL
jgi:hypothetical protein